MITVSAVFGQEEKALGTLGRVGENETRQIAFDCADILAEYPGAEIVCVMQRHCDRTAYLADTVLADNALTVTLTDADVSASGDLRIELRALVDGKIRKSAVYTGQVVSALRGEEDKPGSPAADVLNRLGSALEDAQDATDAANAAAKNAQNVVDTVQAKLDAGEFVGPAGKPGTDASVTAENVQAALGYTPANPADFAPDSEYYLTNLFPDNITASVNQFCRAGNICMFTYQIKVASDLTVGYGATIAQLPFASAVRMWLNNGWRFWVDDFGKNVRLNDEKLAAGNYTLSGMYITTD